MWAKGAVGWVFNHVASPRGGGVSISIGEDVWACSTSIKVGGCVCMRRSSGNALSPE